MSASQKLAIGIIIGIIVGIAAGIPVGIIVSPKPSAQQPPAQKSWHLAAAFNGVGYKTTETFTIQGSRFRINYTIIHANEYGIFGAFVYPEGETIGYVSMMMLNYPQASESTICYKGPGNYYFEINAANLVSWTITVEDYY